MRTYILKFLTVTLVATSLSSKAYATATYVDAWNMTHLNFSVIRYFTQSVYPCEQSVENELACLYLVGGIGQLTDPIQVLIPKGRVDLYPLNQVSVIKALGPVELVKIGAVHPGVTLSERENSILQKQRFDALKLSAQELLKAPSQAGAREASVLERLAEELLEQIPDGQKPAAIATAVNWMLWVHDGHSYLRISDVLLGSRLFLPTMDSEVKFHDLTTNMVEDAGVKFAHLKITTLMSDSICSEVHNAIMDLGKDVHGLILDLRDNPGGLLDQAVCLGALFVGEKPIVYLEPSHAGHAKLPLEPQVFHMNAIIKLPLVVLINANTASAAEILGGALQDYRRGFILGTTSYGKGSYQTAVKLPIFKNEIDWFKTQGLTFEPLGHSHQLVGLRPDFEVFPAPNLSDEQKFVNRESDLNRAPLPGSPVVWQQTRKKEISELESHCLKPRRAQNKGVYEMAMSSAKDSQLFAAEEVLFCQLEHLKNNF